VIKPGWTTRWKISCGLTVEKYLVNANFDDFFFPDERKVTPQEVKIPTRISVKPRITPQERIAALKAHSKDIQGGATEAPSESSTKVPQGPTPLKAQSTVIPEAPVTPQGRMSASDAEADLHPARKSPPKIPLIPPRIPPRVQLEEQVFKRSNSIRKMPAGRTTRSPVVQLTPNLPTFASKPVVNDDVFGVETVVPQRPNLPPHALTALPAAPPSGVPSPVNPGKQKTEKDSPPQVMKSVVTSASSRQSLAPDSRATSSYDAQPSGTVSSLKAPIPLSSRSNMWGQLAASMEMAVEMEPECRNEEPSDPIAPVENVQPVVGRDLIALINATSPAQTHFTGPVQGDSHPLVLAWRRRGNWIRSLRQTDTTGLGMLSFLLHCRLRSDSLNLRR